MEHHIKLLLEDKRGTAIEVTYFREAAAVVVARVKLKDSQGQRSKRALVIS
ncbi:Hypothetical predicted protein [Olea europaea subsp. europaea]|uniref:Uncharacterized protein n=1 Tax=Olea europaea subsp. europaea TaxID=158383 RepID=A0A8S0RZM8_OLEEU|nr:Hypothetical predicted protein [Olea europaea subsp. europaea]